MLIKLHGRDALGDAAQRAGALRDAGDRTGKQVLLAVSGGRRIAGRATAADQECIDRALHSQSNRRSATRGVRLGWIAIGTMM